MNSYIQSSLRLNIDYNYLGCQTFVAYILMERSIIWKSLYMNFHTSTAKYHINFNLKANFILYDFGM